MSAQKPEHSELDEEIILLAKKQDHSAFRYLVRCYQNSVFAVLWRMLSPSGKEALVEDLAQETFLRVFRALPDFELSGPAKLSTWILTIATRLALNELRKKQKSLPYEAESQGLIAESQADEGIRQKQLAKAIESALAELAPDFRAVFLLFEYHELSLQEIAQVLDIKVGTVKSRLSRGRRMMSSTLSEVLS